MESTATRDAVSMPREPATMMIASAQRTILRAVLIKPLRVPSSFLLLSSTLPTTTVTTLIAIRQIRKITIALTMRLAPARPMLDRNSLMKSIFLPPENKITAQIQTKRNTQESIELPLNPTRIKSDKKRENKYEKE